MDVVEAPMIIALRILNEEMISNKTKYARSIKQESPTIILQSTKISCQSELLYVASEVNFSNETPFKLSSAPIKAIDILFDSINVELFAKTIIPLSSTKYSSVNHYADAIISFIEYSSELSYNEDETTILSPLFKSYLLAIFLEIITSLFLIDV